MTLMWRSSDVRQPLFLLILSRRRNYIRFYAIFFTGIHQDASGNWVLSSDATSTGWDLAQIGVDNSNMAYNLSG